MNNFDSLVNSILNNTCIEEDKRDIGKILTKGALGLSLAFGMPATSTRSNAQTKNQLNISHFQQQNSADVESLERFTDLIAALKIIESNNNPNAIGDNGKAKGILQIHKSVIDDVNRIYKTTYVHDDAYNVTKAVDICKKYLLYWGNHYTKKENKKPTLEVLSRIWNGGPMGYKKNSTIKYWKKVKKYLQ